MTSRFSYSEKDEEFQRVGDSAVFYLYAAALWDADIGSRFARKANIQQLWDEICGEAVSSSIPLL